MTFLIIGLILFFIPHSLRIFADDWRTQFIEEKGEKTWKGIYSVVSLIALGLIVCGFGLSRTDPMVLWYPPLWTRHVTSLLAYFAFLLFAAGNIPGNHLKARLGHPMFLGVKIWALAHFISNGRLGDALLFGCFLLWAIAGYSAARKRDRLAGVDYGQGSAKGTMMVFIGGTAVYAVFALYLHRLITGIQPF